ncbi:MAG: hypothetical protein V8R64_01400 [Thomasclavelia sp.]
MAVLVDGDACPDLLEIKKLAKRYLVEMIVFIDYLIVFRMIILKFVFVKWVKIALIRQS